jgi:demethylmenaquinone methyltransferase/2-methoxy-6-polyprenyl-1,4-benzoquinol methylase
MPAPAAPQGPMSDPVTDPADPADPAPEGGPTHFGYETIPAVEKAGRVRGVFRSVAGRYDLMNDLMSGGLHRLWKDAAVDWLAPRPGLRLLDVAGGTGDVAFRVLARAPGARATVLDLTEAMLAEGRRRAEARAWGDRLDWVAGDAMRLPFADASFDATTIAFGIRNVTDPAAALREAHRVLRHGGRLLVLEFSRVDPPALARLYDVYSFGVIPRLGAAVTGDRASYQYLVESIRRFPDQEAFLRMIREAGFGRASFRNLSLGVACLHSAWKV